MMNQSFNYQNPQLPNPQLPNPQLTNPQYPQTFSQQYPQITTPQYLNPQLPNPQYPQTFSPQLPNQQYSQINTPQYPNPQLPNPQLPNPQLPTPQLPTPQLPTPQLPTPQYLTPQLPNPQLQNPQYPQLQNPQYPQIQNPQYPQIVNPQNAQNQYTDILDPQNPQDKEKLRRLLRIKKTEGEMMTTRGYTLKDVYFFNDDDSFQRKDLSALQNPAFTLDDFLNLGFNSRQSLSNTGYYKENNSQSNVIVIYLNNEPNNVVNDEYFKPARDRIEKEKQKVEKLSTHFILITETGFTDKINNYIKNLVGFRVEVFLDVDLAFNYTKHALAPIEIKYIPSSETSQWARREGIARKDKLPMELTSDKIARWYGANSLDVFQLELMGSTTDTETFYRTVRVDPMEKKTSRK